MVLSKRAYDALKFVALILLPAVAAAYFGLEQIWGLPNAEKVVGTITVIDTLLGIVLRSSTSSYKAAGGLPDGTMADGDLVVQRDDGEVYLGLALNKDSFATMPKKDTVTLKVVDQAPKAPRTPSQEPGFE